jgi:hypothetical protein
MHFRGRSKITSRKRLTVTGTGEAGQLIRYLLRLVDEVISVRILAIATFIIGAALAMTACNGIGKQMPIQTKGSYSPELAIKNGDVVNLHGKLSNLEKFDSFVDNFAKGKSDQIRITMYTIEGDPIFYDLDYNGKVIDYTFDNSKDAFGGTGKGKQSTTCTKLGQKSDDKGTAYTLTGCSGDNSRVGESFYFLVPTSLSLITITRSLRT